MPDFGAPIVRSMGLSSRPSAPRSDEWLERRDDAPAVSRSPAGWLGPGLAAAVFLTAVISIAITRQSGRIAAIWFANAFVVALLLRTPPSDWHRWLAWGFAGNLAADLVNGDQPVTALLLSACNSIEIVLAGWLTRSSTGQSPIALSRRPVLLRFSIACATACLVSAAAAAAILHLRAGSPFLATATLWFPTDLLGLLTLVPLLVEATRDNIRDAAVGSRRLDWIVVAFVVPLVTIAVFDSHRLEYAFLLALPLVLAAVRLGYPGVSAGTFLMAAGGFTALALASPLSAAEQSQARSDMTFLQLFMFVNVLALFPAAGLLREARESESRFRQFFERHHVPMWEVRIADGTILQANDAAVDLHGYPRDVLQRMKAWEIAEIGRPAMLRLAADAASRGSGKWLLPHRMASGEIRQVEVAATPLTTCDGVVFAGTLIDRTDELRSAEDLARLSARYQSFTAISSDGIHVLDEHGRLIEGNAAFLESIQAGPDDVGRLTLWDWNPNATPAGAERQLVPYLSDHRRFEAKHRRRDGTEFDVEVQAVGITLDGRPAILASARDISARKALEQRQDELLATLEKRVQEEVKKNLATERVLVHQARLAAMGEMLGHIAHQWRQPLNGLSLVLANIWDSARLGDLTQEEVEQQTGIARGLIQRMSQTVTDFTDFVRADSAAQAFSMCEAIRSAIALVEPGFRSRGVSIRLDRCDDITLTGFPQELRQVLMNLFSNARDAVTAEGRRDGSVWVSLTHDEAACRIVVADNGGGITVVPIERVFEPYFSTKPEAVGLGLYMSRLILERHMRGTIEARNIGGGAQVTIVMPLADERP
jgi:PAS domain S-box-containing protein